MKIPLLNVFGSSEQQALLDDIDRLRQQGVGEFVHLPQIIVGGDQSSGKSSVLGDLSGLPFDRSSSLCTRFATEVILRHSDTSGVLVSIVPGDDATAAERSRLLQFRESLSTLDDFKQVLDKAKREMGILASSKAFSKDILRIEISGPDKPTLTVVDLPGLIHSDSKQQSEADVALVAELVGRYMKNPRSVILAVVSAKNDFACQIVLKRAREVDPEGLRTIGLITKPDTLPEGSELEADYIDLATNNNIVFERGWHVVKNRDYAERDTTTEQRDQSEEIFFSRGVWKTLPRDMVGIASLRRRLGRILLEQIKRYLPDLMDDIQRLIDHCNTRLEKLGGDRETVKNQREFLMKLSESFQGLCKSAANGNYEDPFFGNPIKDEEYCKRLRAVVQNHNLQFAELMRTKGHHREIGENRNEADPTSTQQSENGQQLDTGTEEKDKSEPSKIPEQLQMTRNEAIEWVHKQIQRSRGRELPGSYDPMRVYELFQDQSMNWEYYARDHVQAVWKVLKEFLERLLNSTTNQKTCAALLSYWIDPRVNERYDKANGELDKLLADRGRHPITYNHYYIETLQQLRLTHRAEELTKQLQSFFEKHLNLHGGSNFYICRENIANLARSLSAGNLKDMDSFACSELLDSLHSFYKVQLAETPAPFSSILLICSQVALKTFVDNIAVRVVEAFLIGEIWDIFAPSHVAQMPDELVTSLAAESPESRALRQQLQRKRDTLQKGLEICQKYSSHRANRFVEEKIVSEASRQTQREDEAEAESSDSSAPVIVSKLKFAVVKREANFCQVNFPRRHSSPPDDLAVEPKPITIERPADENLPPDEGLESLDTWNFVETAQEIESGGNGGVLVVGKTKKEKGKEEKKRKEKEERKRKEKEQKRRKEKEAKKEKEKEKERKARKG